MSTKHCCVCAGCSEDDQAVIENQRSKSREDRALHIWADGIAEGVDALLETSINSSIQTNG